MIGIFDSGSGGLSTLHAFQERLPEYDYLYFGDYQNCPYGDRQPDEIYQLSEEGVRKLFDHGAKIVIMACNTAITHSIRKLQSEVFPDKKILGVTYTGGEKAVEEGYDHITVLATQATVDAGTYKERLKMFESNAEIDEIPLPGLVQYIEEHFDSENRAIDDIGRHRIRNFLMQHITLVHPDSEAIMLGCTHYSWIREIVEQYFPSRVVIDPSVEAAKKFVHYLKRHPEIEQILSRGGTTQYLK